MQRPAILQKLKTVLAKRRPSFLDGLQFLPYGNGGDGVLVDQSISAIAQNEAEIIKPHDLSFELPSGDQLHTHTDPFLADTIEKLVLDLNRCAPFVLCHPLLPSP